MKINKDKLASLSAMDDESLWRQIKNIGAAYGIKLPDKTPPKAELDRVREALSGPRLNLTQAIDIINGYRRGE